ncbi:MAG: cystathionine gamma-synthase [Tepidisphaeraceae bacterium]
MKLATAADHAGQKPDPTTGAIMTPVYQTSTYVQDSPGVFKDGYDYARTRNPTRTALEDNLAALEGGKFGICFSSGCASMAAVLHTLKSGDHVVLCDDVYGGTFRIFDKVFKQLGIGYTLVNMTDLAATKAAVNKSTRLIWIETPTNPMLTVVDIAALSQIGKSAGALVAVDNTFATPYLQNPLKFGADIVSHSSTKYIGGHSDVIGGALIVNDPALADRLHYIQNAVGGVPSPWDCFLLLRSTKTLHVRMERHCQNARAVADYLKMHPKVAKVYYPGHENHPQHALAKKQMRDFGGMISAELSGGLAAAKKFLERVRIFSLGESLGGVESLIEHPAIMTHATIPPENRAKLGISDGLIRFSVGIEDVIDLIADIEQALA